MSKGFWRLAAAPLALAILAAAVAAESPTNQQPQKYTLRYRFRPGQVLRWEVLQQGHVQTTMVGTTETLDTVTRSIKIWTVKRVDSKGTATFEHSVDEVQMQQERTGSPKIYYDSTKDKKPPAGFEGVAKSIRKPLTIVEMDARGKILSRQRTPLNTSPVTEGEMAIPFPEEAISVGYTWSIPYDAEVRLQTGGVQKIKTLQSFTLDSVATGVATIQFRTEVLTPIHDPAIELQVAERESKGSMRFDIDAGRVLSQQTDLDKRIVGFRGQASSYHHLSRLTERLLENGDAPAL